jgi:hypothetical protein
MALERKGTFTLQSVFDHIGREDKIYEGDSIHMDSLRYEVFRNNPVCVKCGLKGQYFAKERNILLREIPGQNPDRYHFNMYGVNEKGEEILFTKDHIIPRSKGGNNGIKNMQTMCYLCNQEKADEVEVADVKEA